MSWRDQLFSASFNGVDFLCDAHQEKSARSIAIYEYPLSDNHSTKDLGVKAKEYNLDAYVIGSDYVDVRDKLRSELTKEGVGDLVHPYLGNMSVRVKDVSLSESTQKGGMAKFSISLIEAGKEVELNKDFSSLLASSNTAIDKSLLDYFKDAVLSVDGVNTFLGKINSEVSTINADITGVASIINDVKSNIEDIIDSPSKIINSLRLVYSAFNGSLNSLKRVDKLSALQQNFKDVESESKPNQLTITKQVIRLSAVSNVLIDTDFLSKEELEKIATDYKLAIDKARSNITGELADTLDYSRAITLEALKTKKLPEEKVETIYKSLPGYVLAHRLGVTEDIITELNKVDNPLLGIAGEVKYV